MNRCMYFVLDAAASRLQRIARVRLSVVRRPLHFRFTPHVFLQRVFVTLAQLSCSTAGDVWLHPCVCMYGVCTCPTPQFQTLFLCAFNGANSYGWLCALTALGSCVGLVSWSAKMWQLLNLLIASDLIVQRAFQELDLYYAAAAKWQAVFLISYAFEFLCLSAAKLLVLDRMSVFAIANANKIDMKRWTTCGQITIAVVATCNFVGVAANLAAAAIFLRSSDSYLSAHALFNNSIARRAMVGQAQSENDEALSAASVQSFCEVAALLIIVAAFALVGFLCIRRISTSMLAIRASHANAAEGIQLRRQIFTTTAFIFVTFLLRSVFSIMYACRPSICAALL